MKTYTHKWQQVETQAGDVVPVKVELDQGQGVEPEPGQWDLFETWEDGRPASGRVRQGGLFEEGG